MKLRIFRSPHAKYYGEDILEAPAIYAADYLSALTGHGFNGIWLRARLRDVSKTDVFPSLGAAVDRYREALRQTCTQCAAHGVGVYLYLNEPLCFPADHPFWGAHPETRGATGTSRMDEWPETNALCTSQQIVQEWLVLACEDLFRQCPDIAGVFTITASEHHTHCCSHNMKGDTDCPLCAERDPAEVVAEVNNLILEGIRRAGSAARVIAWNWSWSLAGEATDVRVIRDLHPDIALMIDFERGGRKRILGKDRLIDEYSLSYVGPSERFLAAFDAAAANDQEVFAKLQIGTTHEIATVNNLPLIPNLLRKARWLRRHKIDGALCCWNFGNRLTLNTWAFNHFLDDPKLALKTDKEVLEDVARGYLGVRTPYAVIQAWASFTEAFHHYPFSIRFLYAAPINYAPVYPLPGPGDPERPMQRSWVPLEEPFGTRLEQTCEGTGYSLEDCRDALRAMTDIFDHGLDWYFAALDGSDNEHAARELRNARAIRHILQSTRNIYSAYLICQTRPFDEAAWQAVARDEAEQLKRLHQHLEGETEIGYHSEAASWFFTTDKIMDKIAFLEQMIQ